MQATLKRAGQFGLLAKDLASARLLGRGPDRSKVVRRVVDRLGLMHGLPQKIGQLMAFSDIEGCDPLFGRLTEDSTSRNAEEVFEQIRSELGRPLNHIFDALDENGISASIGQVHRGTLKDGREVAVKVQFPGLSEQLEVDLRALGWLTAPVEGVRKGFDASAFQDEIGCTLLAELDYRQEAAALRFFALKLNPTETQVVPEVIEELSTGKVLTTRWIDGARLSSVLRWPNKDRSQVAEILLSLFLRSVFCWGKFHADPHPGNYRFQRNDRQVRVGLLDFGCVKDATPALQSGLAGLVEDSIVNRATSTSIFEHFLRMGFNEKLLAPLRSRLPEVNRIICEPFLCGGGILQSEWNPGARLASALGEDRMNFRLAGPPPFLFFFRAFQGLLHYLSALQVPVNWRAAWEELPATATGTILENTPGELQTECGPVLKIQVMRRGETTVSLEFDRRAAGQLPSLVPTDIRASLHARAIDLQAMADTAASNHFRPGELFSLVDGERAIRVWIE